METYDDSCLPTNPTTENDYHGSFPYCSVHAQIFGSVSDSMIMRKKAPANEQEALRDVVWETRTINKKLHVTPIHPNITSILIVSKPGDEEVEEKVRELIDWLLSLENVVIFIQKSMESVFQKHERIQYWTTLLCTKHSQLFDLVLALGGDGTVLYTSRLFQRTVPPIMPFAMGTLGFLTHFDINNYKNSISEICKEMYIHLRTRFECRVMKKRDRSKLISIDRHLSQSLRETDTDTHDFTNSLVVLNEVVIDRGPNTAMSDLMLYVDSKYLTTVKADGLCVSTPTGSTAYSLAAGGSLCHPDISVMIVSPICAHSLSLRPIHVPDSMALHVVVPQDASQSSWISFDGRNRTELLPGDYLTVRISRYPFPTVHSSEDDADWFESIKRTLMWNQN